MKVVHRFLLVLLLSMILVGVVYKLSNAGAAPSTDPVRIPTYNEVVPKGMSALDAPRVLDFRDVGELLKPRLAVTKVSDSIIGISCPAFSNECAAKALLAWVKQEVTYQEVLDTRDFIISPEETILYREMNDETGSVLLASLLRAQGISTRVANGPYSSFVEASWSGEVVYLDPGCGSCRINQKRFRGEDAQLVWVS